MSTTISGDNITYTAEQWVGSEIVSRTTLTGDSIDTTPDATSFAAQFGGLEAVNTTFRFIIINNSSFVITLQEGVGFTMSPSSTSTIQPGTANEYLIIITSSTTCSINNLSYNGTPIVAQSITTIVDSTSPNVVIEDSGLGSNTITLSTPSPLNGGGYTWIFPPTNGGANQVLANDGSGVLSWINSEFFGPVSSTDNALARWNGTVGNNLQNSGITIDDSNLLTTPGNISLTGSTSSITHSGITSLDITSTSGTVNIESVNFSSGEISGVTI